jgi:hypothetical protein
MKSVIPVRMVSLSIMAPTRTNRRHFFLLEDGADIQDMMTSTLTLIGFHISPVNHDQFDDESAQISIAESSQDENHHFLAGAISPASNVIERHRKYVFLLKIFGILFISLEVAFDIGLASMVITYLAGLVNLFHILAIPTSFSLLGWLLFATLTAISGVVVELVTTKANYQIASQICPEIISKISQLDPMVSVDEISVKTRISERALWKHLPEPFREKLEELNLGKVNAFYWNLESKPELSIGS